MVMFMCVREREKDSSVDCIIIFVGCCSVLSSPPRLHAGLYVLHTAVSCLT